MWVFTHTRQKACAQELRVTMGSISLAAVPRKRITLLGTRKSTGQEGPLTEKVTQYDRAVGKPVSRFLISD